MSKLQITIDGQAFEVELSLPNDSSEQIRVLVNGEPVHVTVPALAGPEAIEWAIVNHWPYDLQIDHDLRWIQSNRGRHSLEIHDVEMAVSRPSNGDGRIKAPIPGMITRLLVEPGQPVEAGQPVLVLEAMKMENEIRAPRSGTLTNLYVKAGQGVKLFELIAEIG